ncbi:MAG: hypothetical protein ACRDLN_07425 [Solirubrobacteraceae bacterium]
MSRSTLPATALAVLALLLGGCGEDDVFRTDRPLMRVTLDEYRIVPQNLAVKPQRLKFVVRNVGRLTHNLVIQIPEGADGKPVEIARVSTMQPGETGEPIKVALRPGKYRLVCTIANHDDLGQYGQLEVRAGTG